MNLSITGTYTDLYQLAMGSAYFADGKHEMPASFDYFFRKIPFEGGYVIFAGLNDILEILEELHFTENDLEYLAGLGFNRDYLNVLKDFRFRGNVLSQREGEVVFPTEPILRVEGTILEAQLVETLLLNILNFESLIATKAARIRSVAGEAILSDFGMRRAHGPGAVLASRAAIIGGFDSTSNVHAARNYGLPCEGTMAHSFIQLYGDELTAFRKFAEARPENSVFLVDTYSTLKSGLPNAIKVAKEMEERGHKLRGIRLDSGDLSFFARRARHMLDEAGLHYVKIAASNQLDEYVVRSLLHQKAPIDIFGVGTSLVTGNPDAALDGVYKLASADSEPRIKVSENIKKVTIPGAKQVYRYFAEDGSFFGADAIAQADESIPDFFIHPFETHKRMHVGSIKSEALLQPVMQNGKAIRVETNVHTIRAFSLERLAKLPPEYKRFENPHVYKIGITEKTERLRNELQRKYAPAKAREQNR